MSWTLTGTDTYRNATSGQLAATLPAATIGDMRVLLLFTANATIFSNGVAGAGVSTWMAGDIYSISSSSLTFAATAQMFYGAVTSAGTALTLSYTGALGSTSCRMMSRTFRSNRGLVVAPTMQGDAFQQTGNTTTPSPLTWSSVTTGRPGQLVVGCMGNVGGGTGYTGVTSGYTYTTDSDGNQHQYNGVLPGVYPQTPQMTYSGTDGWYVMQGVFDDGIYVPTSLQSNAQAVSRSSIW